jgi:hypothetical protein
MAEPPFARPIQDEDRTPPTRSYVEQLLHGNMSASEISTLRSEIGENPDEDEARTILRAGPSAPPSSPPDEDDDDEGGGGARTAVHVYSPDELAREAELRRRAALRNAVAAPPKRGPGTVPPATPSSPGPSAHRTAPPAAPSSSVPPAPPSSGRAHAHRSAPPAAPSRSAPPVAPSRSAPPPAAPSRTAPPPTPAQAPQPTARTLTQAFLKAIGGNDGVLQIAVPPARLTELQLSSEAGFVISRIDGMTSIEETLDLSPLGRVETLRILHDLLRTGVLRIGGGP